MDGMRQGWTKIGGIFSGHRQVAKFLTEQVEAAVLVLVNKKVDTASTEDVAIAPFVRGTTWS
jgi:hypothetical protein